jgi:hypothetical protein
MVSSPKLLKTHEEEAFFKSGTIKGFSFGYTMDKVRGVETIKDFITPEKLLKSVVATEREKEGVISCEGISSIESPNSASHKEGSKFVPAYSLEYTVKSTRGENRFFVEAAILDRKLYVATAQVAEGALDDDVRKACLGILESFSIEGDIEGK